MIALVLLALWLPATSHCALEALSEHVGEVCATLCSHDAVHDADSGRPAADACAAVEDGAVKADSAAIAAPAPMLFALACLDCLRAAILTEADAVEPAAYAAAHPDDWVPRRHIESRAAAPARAPGLV